MCSRIPIEKERIFPVANSERDLLCGLLSRDKVVNRDFLEDEQQLSSWVHF